MDCHPCSVAMAVEAFSIAPAITWQPSNTLSVTFSPLPTGKRMQSPRNPNGPLDSLDTPSQPFLILLVLSLSLSSFLSLSLESCVTNVLVYRLYNLKYLKPSDSVPKIIVTRLTDISYMAGYSGFENNDKGKNI